MALWKSVPNEKTGILERQPVDAAAHLEILNLDRREGRVSEADYQKRKAEIEKGFSEAKIADRKTTDAKVSAQAKQREDAIKAQSDKKKAQSQAAAFRSAEKAKRKNAANKGGK